MLGRIAVDPGHEGPADLSVDGVGDATGTKDPERPLCGLDQATVAPLPCGSSARPKRRLARRQSSASRCFESGDGSDADGMGRLRLCRNRRGRLVVDERGRIGGRKRDGASGEYRRGDADHDEPGRRRRRRAGRQRVTGADWDTHYGPPWYKNSYGFPAQPLTAGDFTEAAEPFALFESWLAEARQKEINDPEAMAWRPSTKRACPTSAWFC